MRWRILGLFGGLMLISVAGLDRGIILGAAQETWFVRGGDAKQGRPLIVRYGCAACHVVDGVGKATGRVGPKLQDIQQQVYIGGVLPNTAENMIRWIMEPQRFSPESAMPDLDVPEQEARHIAAYLFEN
jgi:cytochrome c